jgi:hypothetical protein
VLVFAVRRVHDDGYLSGRPRKSLQLRQHIAAIDVRQPDIEQDRIWFALGDERRSFAAGHGVDDFDTSRARRPFDGAVEQVIVVNDQQQDFRVRQSLPPTRESKGGYRLPSIDFAAAEGRASVEMAKRRRKRKVGLVHLFRTSGAKLS